MSSRNMPAFRHSYIEHHVTDDESSESITSYMDDMDTRRKGDRRDSAGRSIRSSHQSLSKTSPQRSFDDDSEAFSRRGYRHSVRERRASSSARSNTSRTERRPPSRVRSDSTQDSEVELGTKALVQAKIREKVAQASSSPLDESSSDLFKPKGTKVTQIEKPTATTLATKKVEKIAKTPSKLVDRRKSIEKGKTNMVQAQVRKFTAVADKSIKKFESEPTAKEPSPNEIDLNNVPDTVTDGPPKTPDYDWTCEYCTFVNEPNIKICSICCKTPSATAVRKQKSPEKTKTPPTNGKIHDSAEISKEGKRKISFWPGTKPK